MEVLANDTQSRHFLAIVLRPMDGEDGGSPFKRLIRAVDAALHEYGKLPFYDPPKLHFSVAWSTQPIRLGLDVEPSRAAALRGAMRTLPPFACEQLTCRIGTSDYPVRLTSAHDVKCCGASAPDAGPGPPATETD